MVSWFLHMPAVVLVVFVGLYLSSKSRWLQLSKLPLAASFLLRDSTSGITSFSALCAVIGGNLGVGNISGTAVALRSGGPGFILWMVIIIVVTSIIKYATCYISISTKLTVDQKTFGGPIVYLQQAFGTSKASLIALIVMVTCSITVGNLVQVNSLSVPMHLVNQSPIAAGFLMAGVFLALVTLAGIDSITKAVSIIVPVMTVSYLTLTIVTLIKFSHNILPSMKLICNSFLNIHSLKMGTISAFVVESFHIIQVGTLRGVFAADIGLGLEGTLHSMVEGNDEDSKIRQGLISLISPFIVAVVAMMTTMTLLVTNVWTDTTLESTNMCFVAFKKAMNYDYTGYILMALMFCFSFTTILTWFLCSRDAVLYTCRNSTAVKVWSAFFIAIIPLGSVCAVRLLWDIADLCVSLAIIVNTVAIVLLVPRYQNMFSVGCIKKIDR